MTEEEKKAIEYFKEQEIRCINNAEICDENDFDEEATHLRKEQYFIKTILNLIKKQEKQIKFWRNGFERELESNQANTTELLKQDLIIRNKDKIINEMADRLAVDDFCPEASFGDWTPCEKDYEACECCIKRYFENKAKED